MAFENALRYLCKYQVAKLILALKDEKMELDPSNVMGIEYLNDYDFNHMAMLKITTRIDIRKRLWILKNKKEIRCFFELSKIGLDVDMEKTLTEAEECWNLEFGIYFNDEDDSIDVGILEQRLKLNEEKAAINELEEENYFETQHIQDLYLFNPKLLKASRTSFNRVWTEDMLHNCTGEMLTETKHTNVLISKFENDEVYQELLIPNNPVYKCLMYLDQEFGMYEKGALIYYDIDTLYLINLNGKVTAKRDQHGGHEPEWTETTFVIPNIDNSQPGNGMIRVDEEKIFYPTITELEINPQKFSIAKNVSLGSEAKIVITDDVTIGVETADQSYIDQRNESVTYIKKKNKFSGKVLKARMEENECILYISAQNIDINAFTPNKTFRVNFTDQTKQDRFGVNEYRLAYAYHFLKATSTEYMDSSHRIILKKTAGPLVNQPSDDQG